jgi:hypothetical protein
MTEPQWAELSDDELLRLRFCDLNLRVEETELESRVAELYHELDTRGLAVKPLCYLGEEWFSPDGSPSIAIPFFLAHPRLKQLELHQILEVEGGTPEWCLQLLRHECGHAYDHAYRFSEREQWTEVFGNPDAEYAPETYRPRPHSRSYVHHLPNSYAQAHPHEDFAETFAVWLSLPEEEWRQQYQGWKALEKLEYVNSLILEARENRPLVAKGRRVWDASRSRRTLAKHYAAKRKLYAEDFPDFHDEDLRRIFGKQDVGSETAAAVLKRLRKPLLTAIVHWTHQRKYTVDMLIRRLIERCRELNLRAPNDREQLTLELASYLAAMVTNYLHTGRFKGSVRQ